MARFVVLGRYFEKNFEKAKSSVERLEKFCQSALDAGAEKVLVAVNTDEDVSRALLVPWPKNVEVFPVTPWGHFVLPLNALLIKGRSSWATGCHALTASIEVVITREIALELMFGMDHNTFVVGAALEGHQYEKGMHYKANGRQCPWGTLALWNAPMLYKYGGFHLAGDGPPNEPQNAGVEEVVTIARAQRLAPDWDDAFAKLIRVSGVGWDTSHFDGDRLKKHEAKMRSKVERPSAQLDYIGLRAPNVFHY